MLKLKYSIGSVSDTQEIVLDDKYVSQGLEFISGTTEHNHIYAEGGTLWVHSPYFPDNLPADITSVDVVKRNGYVLAPVKLQVHKGYTVSGLTSYDRSLFQVVNYTEYNGNTYFGYSSGGTGPCVFEIEGEEYSGSSSFVTAMVRHYVEDNKVSVDGITYNVFINNDGEVSFTDSVGKPYTYTNDWDISNVTKDSVYVDKLVIGENHSKPINCSRISYYGYKAYIVYKGKKYYMEYFYDNDDNIVDAGVVIDGASYICEALHAGNEDGFDASTNIYNRNSYFEDLNGNCVMTIEDSQYIIGFESCEIEGSGIICIETITENLPIILNDRITVRSTNTTSQVRVRYDDNDQAYAYFNGRRYDSVSGLCDCVIIDEREYQLTYDGDCTNVPSGTTASAVMDDGSLMNFMVTYSINGRPQRVKKVEYVDGVWRDLYSFTERNGVVSYSASTAYEVETHNGILIDGDRYRIYTNREVTGYYDDNNYSEIVYDYISINSMLGYNLVVIDTIGSNKILCVPDVNPLIYGTTAVSDLTAEILCSVLDTPFIIEKRANTFGTTDLYYDTWIAQAALVKGPTSVYELADIYNNIRLLNISGSYTIPISLSRNVSDKMEYDDLITNLYYSEEDSKMLNSIVDMDKDMYSPVFKPDGYPVRDVDSIIFNLHFRTRELDTWKVIEDEGKQSISVGGTNVDMNLTANFQYCNWFVTDYYPFHDYPKYNSGVYGENTFLGNRFKDVITRSDLLGFMYFTTNDVKEKREKLKKSFLRLTFFDSRNPEKQNMLGTSTLFFDCDRYSNLISMEKEDIHYEECVKTRNPNRMPGETETSVRIDQMPNTVNAPTVLTQAFNRTNSDNCTIPDMYIGDENMTLDSRITVQNRYNSNNSSEGFYMYILKEFGDKKKPKTVYMKAEFFHAGLGKKIPMVLPTKKSTSGVGTTYPAISTWTKNEYDGFVEGYELESVFDRLYIPIVIEYDNNLRKFIYHIADDDNYLNTVTYNGNNWMFNLFELKIKSS